MFNILLSNDFIDHLVHQTNYYAQSEHKPFTPVTKIEMNVFLGLNVLMGIKKLPSYKDYWSSNIQLRDHYISSKMSLNRFSWFLSHLHVNNNDLQPKRHEPNFDKLYKIRPLLDHLSANFLNYFEPGKNQSIDESMILFKGRSSIKQYMPMKPIKRGYKVWVRADESGYICEFQVYTGKLNSAETSLGKRVVIDLTRNLVGKYHHVYFDNFFTSVELMEQLLNDGIYACGTVRANRKGLPTNQINEKLLKKGDSESRLLTNGVAWVKWRDNRTIQFLSNFHNPNQISVCKRKNKDGTKSIIRCPQAVKDYNLHMGYVDHADMMKSFYELSRKSKKWWHRIFFHFLDVTVVNSFKLFNYHSEGTPWKLKEFRLAVSAGLIGIPEVVSRGKKRSLEVVNHYKQKVPLETRFASAAHMPSSCTSRRCNLCSTKQNPCRTKWECTSCEVGLCMTKNKNFFKKYHTK